MSADQTVEVRT